VSLYALGFGGGWCFLRRRVVAAAVGTVWWPLGLEWHSLEEVVGAGIQYLGQSLTAHHTVRVRIAPDFPLLEMDAILMERVFSNLLENAAKFSPPGSAIEIEARPSLQSGRISRDSLPLSKRKSPMVPRF
jgi:signal transduction histidine kinase